METDPVVLACSALGVEYVRALRPGAQKSVHAVRLNGNDVVLKVVLTGSSTPTALERAQREVALLQEVTSPFVVQALSGLTIVHGTQAVAWLEEYLPGEDLISRLGTPWPEGAVRTLGLQVASGVGALHELQVVHRDLSPNNIRCITNTSFKVMDPGFAKHGLLAGITVGGQPGTLGYLSPEHVIPGAIPTPASDVFSVGVLMFAAATCALPFSPQEGEAHYFASLLGGRYTPIGQLRQDLPDCLTEIIERALHPQPARRFRNGMALARALEDCR